MIGETCYNTIKLKLADIVRGLMQLALQREQTAGMPPVRRSYWRAWPRIVFSLPW